MVTVSVYLSAHAYWLKALAPGTTYEVRCVLKSKDISFGCELSVQWVKLSVTLVTNRTT